MLVPPRDLSVTALSEAVHAAFGIELGSLQYLPVGFGSHHWADGKRWFLSVDPSSPELRSALSLAVRARRLGFPVAPRLSLQGQPLAQIDERFSVAVYPYVEGTAGRFSDTFDDDTATLIVGHLAQLHGLETVGTRMAPFARLLSPEELRVPDEGPFGGMVNVLIDSHVSALRAAYEQLRAVEADHCVSTHGEPHPGNWLTTSAGLRLVDWDTAGMAPPERDIWLVARRTGLDAVGMYEELTGRPLDHQLLRHYEVAWLYSDVVADVRDLSQAVVPDADTEWQLRSLRDVLANLASA